MTDIRIDLSPVVNRIEELGNMMDRQMSQVHASVGQVQSEVVTTQAELLQLRQRFEEYVTYAERTANVQRAETKLSGLKDDLEREFGHHSVVRRTSIGILQAFDVGNVSNRTVSQVSEELMIQTPRYWLAPAIVALAAWSRGDEEMTKVSLAEAFRRDTRKTALFFALVLRRQARLDASVRWLRQYLLGMDPMLLTREFVVVLECINLGAFGPQGEALAAEKLSEWNEQLRRDPEIVDKQVEAWRAFIGTQCQRLDDDQFPVLRRTSPQWPTLQYLLEMASALPVTIEWFEAVRDRIDHRSAAAHDVLDSILENLVTEFDQDELPLRRKILYNESVIDENGDLDRAQSRADALQSALDENTDVVSLQTNAAIQPDVAGVGAGTQRAAISVSRDEAVAGVGRFTFGYRSQVLPAIGINLSPTHSGYATTFNFPGWQARSDTPEQHAIADLTNTWKTALAAERERLRFKPSTMTVPIIIAAVATIVLFLINPIAGIVGLLGGGGIVAFLWTQRQKKADAALAALDAAETQAIDESIRLYRAAIAEYIDLGEEYRALDSQEAELLQLLRTWAPASTTAVTA